MPRTSDSSAVPPVIERFLKTLVVTAKAVVLYPPASSIPLQTAEGAKAALDEALRACPEVTLLVTRDGIVYRGAPVFEGNAAYRSFAFDLYSRRLADVRFRAGTGTREIVAFLSLLKLAPEELEASGGFESRLWEQGVSSITVTQAQVRVVDVAPEDAEPTDATALSVEELERALEAASAGSERERRTIVRLLGNREAVARFVAQAFGDAGTPPDLVGAAARFTRLAEIAYEAPQDQSAALLRSLAESLREIQAPQCRDLLTDELLANARTNEAVAASLRNLDVGELCKMLVADLEESPEAQAGLARALRALALISGVDRGEIVASASIAMHGAGASADFAEQVLEVAAPSQLTVESGSSDTSAPASAADAILRLIDLAPGAGRAVGAPDDPETLALAAEARAGITDGDVVMALVTLAGLDTRDVPFATTMATVEDSIGLLVERGEVEIAADVVLALRAIARDPALSIEQKRRVNGAINRLADPADIRAITDALRLHPTGSPEHRAAEALVEALGGLAIEPMLEQLAAESDMSARKSLVEVLSAVAPGHVGEFGRRVTDPRWYVVRNIVAILGASHSPEAIPYLGRAVHHLEPRVRREAIRALSAIPAAGSRELLITALSDEDAQNVQLAARYLGALDAIEAVPGAR